MTDYGLVTMLAGFTIATAVIVFFLTQKEKRKQFAVRSLIALLVYSVLFWFLDGRNADSNNAVIAWIGVLATHLMLNLLFFTMRMITILLSGK